MLSFWPTWLPAMLENPAYFNETEGAFFKEWTVNNGAAQLGVNATFVLNHVPAL